MSKLLIILGLSTFLFGKMGYLQQTIKSPQNTICVYKYNGSLYGVNVGKKPVCRQSLNLKSIIKK